MREVYEFVASGYDSRLAAMAIVVCALASTTAIRILAHAARTTGHMREIWLWVAAAAGGSGAWATHFIAMLAYDPGIPCGYNLGLAVLIAGRRLRPHRRRLQRRGRPRPRRVVDRRRAARGRRRDDALCRRRGL